MSPARLLVAVGFLLVLVAVGWFVRTGRWKQKRLALVTFALFASLLLLFRRVSLVDLGILAGLVLAPIIILPPPRRR